MDYQPLGCLCCGLWFSPDCNNQAFNESYSRKNRASCPACKGQGEFIFILYKTYDHPVYDESDDQFATEFFGYNIEENRDRFCKEPWGKIADYVKAADLNHHKKYQCCKTCHRFVMNFRKGENVKRSLTNHLAKGDCLG